MKIAVIGSINIDVIYQVDKMPVPGETLFGKNYKIFDGGKGANQAVILSSLEEEVTFFGAVGNDVFGDEAKANLMNKGLKGDIITKSGNSGLAIIQIANSDNSIIVFKGANDEINKADIDTFFINNPKLDIIVLQLEINLEAIIYLIDQAYEKGIKVILNPAPAVELNKDIVDKVAYLIPNETEAEAIFKTDDLEEIVKSNNGKVLITMGRHGVMYYDGNVPKMIPAQTVDVVDTTGAGDSFVAGFTSGIAQGLPLKEAVLKGIAIASITCTYLGAQASYKQIEKEWKK